MFYYSATLSHMATLCDTAPHVPRRMMNRLHGWHQQFQCCLIPSVLGVVGTIRDDGIFFYYDPASAMLVNSYQTVFSRLEV